MREREGAKKNFLERRKDWRKSARIGGTRSGGQDRRSWEIARANFSLLPTSSWFVKLAAMLLRCSVSENAFNLGASRVRHGIAGITTPVRHLNLTD